MLWLIDRQGLAGTLVDVALELLAALALTPVLRNLLSGVSAPNPATFVSIAWPLTGVFSLPVSFRRGVRRMSTMGLR